MIKAINSIKNNSINFKNNSTQIQNNQTILPAIKQDVFISNISFKASEGVNFYDKNAKSFVESTKDLTGMQETCNIIAKELKPKSLILDAGCGSGRDSLHMKELGFKVTATDGSKEVCNEAEKILGQKVIHIEHKDIKDFEKYDCVMALASLVHMDDDKELHDSIKALSNALKPNGIFYTAFKHGNKIITEGKNRKQRFVNKESMDKILETHPELKIKKTWIGEDTMKRPDNDWFNVIMIKTK